MSELNTVTLDVKIDTDKYNHLKIGDVEYFRADWMIWKMVTYAQDKIAQANGTNKQIEKVLPIHIVSNRSFNELEMLAEDLECVKMWLDNKNVPRHDKDNNQYSVIGRIELLLNGC